MASRKLPEGAFRAKNGVWCVKKKCERCGREFNAGLVLNPKHCKDCRQVLKNRRKQKTAKYRQKAFAPQKSVWESRAESEYGFDEKAALKQGSTPLPRLRKAKWRQLQMPCLLVKDQG